MILSDSNILNEMSVGNIIIYPFDKKYLNPVSVDLTLAPNFKIYKKGVLDPKKPNEVEEYTIPEEGYILLPGEVYLYAVNEKIGVLGNIRGKVEGKSSLGRLGLFIHVTAGFIDPGFVGSLVLELVATRPIIVYPNMKICQIEFARVEGNIYEPYNVKLTSKYLNQVGVQESLMHKNFKDDIK